jgi:hypothetical protein
MADQQPYFFFNATLLSIEEIFYEFALRGQSENRHQIANLNTIWRHEEMTGTIPLTQPGWMSSIRQAQIVRSTMAEISHYLNHNSALLVYTWTRFYSVFWRFQRLEWRYTPYSPAFRAIIEQMDDIRRIFLARFIRVPREHNRMRRWLERREARYRELPVYLLDVLETRDLEMDFDVEMRAEGVVYPDTDEETGGETPTNDEEQGADELPSTTAPAETQTTELVANEQQVPQVPDTVIADTFEPGTQTVGANVEVPTESEAPQTETCKDDENLCKICYVSRTDTAVEPCGHCFCFTCTDRWNKEKGECPKCREKITKLLRIYF